MLASELSPDTLDKLDQLSTAVLNLNDDTRAINGAERHAPIAWQLAIQPFPWGNSPWKNVGRKTVNYFCEGLKEIGASHGIVPHNLMILRRLESLSPPERITEKLHAMVRSDRQGDSTPRGGLWLICGTAESQLPKSTWRQKDIMVLKAWLASLGLKLDMSAREVFFGTNCPTALDEILLTPLRGFVRDTSLLEHDMRTWACASFGPRVTLAQLWFAVRMMHPCEHQEIVYKMVRNLGVDALCTLPEAQVAQLVTP